MIRLSPDDDYAHRVRGDCLRYKGEYDKAIADFGTALGLDPENAAAWKERLARVAVEAVPSEYRAALESGVAAGQARVAARCPQQLQGGSQVFSVSPHRSYSR